MQTADDPSAPFAPQPDELPETLGELVCFALYSAHHAVNRAYKPLLDRIGLTYPQYIALVALWEKDGQTVGELCDRLRMTSGTVTPLVQRLETLGHVARRRSAEDERRVHVWLTERGRALQDEAPEITRCVVGATGLDPDALHELVATIVLMRDNIDAAVDGPLGDRGRVGGG